MSGLSAALSISCLTQWQVVRGRKRRDRTRTGGLFVHRLPPQVIQLFNQAIPNLTTVYSERIQIF
jgi:hypothetical protein